MLTPEQCQDLEAMFRRIEDEERARFEKAFSRVRHYVKTGRSIHDPQPPTLWQRIARWWNRA